MGQGSGQQLQQSGLAAAIGPQQHPQLALGNDKTARLQNRRTFRPSKGQALHPNGHLRHGDPLAAERKGLSSALQLGQKTGTGSHGAGAARLGSHLHAT